MSILRMSLWSAAVMLAGIALIGLWNARRTLSSRFALARERAERVDRREPDRWSL